MFDRRLLIWLCCTVALDFSGAQARAPKGAGIDIKGSITNVFVAKTALRGATLGSIIVEGKPGQNTQFDKASLRVTAKTKIRRQLTGKSINFTGLEKGMEVECTITGPVAESYPVQATADAITVVSGARVSTAKPSHNQPIVGSSAVVSGQASSSSGVTGPGKLVTPGDRQNEPPQQLNLGEPTEEERKVVSAFASEFDPRSAIGKFANSQPSSGQPRYFLQRGQIIFLGNPALKTCFPDRLFYVLRFPQWPIAMMVPPPFSNNNIFVFGKDGNPKFIANADQLTDYFKANLREAKSSSQQGLAVLAWLAISQEQAQDGMFRFSTSPKDITIQPDTDGTTAGGKAVVEPSGGNSGEITAKLVFDKSGKLEKVTQNINLRAGMRPICQSTKLLDHDPIVRKMAEQDLLIMGKACKPYLDEQRAKLSPELQQAIDRVWQRIVDEDR